MKALLVVDYQNDFVTGSLGFPECRELEDIIADKVIQAKMEGTDVYFTRDAHGPDYLNTQEGRRLPVEHCMDKEGRKLFGILDELSEGCTVMDKSTFGNGDVADHFASKGYDEVEICGVLTNICVLFNAILIKTALPEARIVIDAKAVMSNDKALNDKTLDVLASCQFDITNRD